MFCSCSVYISVTWLEQIRVHKSDCRRFIDFFKRCFMQIQTLPEVASAARTEINFFLLH